MAFSKINCLRYLDLFDFPINDTFKNFEKSDLYFEDPKVPKRMQALLNENTKYVLFLTNPSEKAKSCYNVSFFNFQFSAM